MHGLQASHLNQPVEVPLLRPRLRISATSSGFAYGTPGTYQVMRIEAGQPAYGAELSDDANPLEVGLSSFISFTKGCYIGQEVIARIRTYGQVAKALRGLRLPADAATLPANLRATHVSLFDGTNCGIAITGKRAFGVQYHPEASPGPQDSFYLFQRFVEGL